MDEIPFGDWVRLERERRGWKQHELANNAGVSQAQISNIESGKSLNPQARTREKIQNALGSQSPNEPDEIKEETTIEGIGDLIDFDPYEFESLPECPGVYVFYDITDRPVYVGIATKRYISNRVPEHEEKFWFKRPIVNRGAYVQIEDEDMCKKVERVLIRFLKSNALLNKKHTVSN